MNQLVLACAGAIYCGLGVLHGALTASSAARAFSPIDQHLREAVQSAPLRLHPDLRFWDAWVGFNWSHGLGLIVFGLMLMLFAGELHPLYRTGIAPPIGIALIACAYFALAVRYWFWVPAAGTGLAALLVLLALVLRFLG